jgi:hypothetical protein
MLTEEETHRMPCVNENPISVYSSIFPFLVPLNKYKYRLDSKKTSLGLNLE